MSDRYSGRSPPRRSLPRRDRDDHPDVEYFGAGESYRPGGAGEGPYRPGIKKPKETWVNSRRDERRREDIDSYIPPTSIRAQRNRSRSPPPYRRRSRSPPSRGRTELFPDRPRSPPRRYSPARNDRARSPPRRRSRSPYGARGRTPEIKRDRDLSPAARQSPRRDRIDSPPRQRFDRARSPPRRPASPPRSSYRSKSRSPPRKDDRRPNYADETWRRRSPSPRASGPASTNTSRISSPPIHADRTSLAGSGAQSPAPYRERDRPYESRRDNNYPSRPRSPQNERAYHDRERDDHQISGTGIAVPTGPKNAGSFGDRPPPSGPSRGPTYTQQASPPIGPSSTYAGPNRSRDFVSPPGAMRGRTSLTYRAPGYRPPSYSTPFSPIENASLPTAALPNSPVPPSGPRGSGSTGRGSYPLGPSRTSSNTYHAHTDFPYRSNNSTSTTYPRSQRFNSSATPIGTSALTSIFTGDGATTASPVSTTPVTGSVKGSVTQAHLATLERIIPGGKRTPGLTSGMNPTQEAKLRQLEDDAERIRIDVLEKQKVKREALREWEVRERESQIAGLRSELAEESLRALEQGDEDSGVLVGAAF